MGTAGNRNCHPESTYRIRILFSVAVVELLVLGVVLFWPSPRDAGPVYQDITPDNSEVVMEEIQQTSQEETPPPPPRPPVPVPVPNDRVIEEDPITFDEMSFDSYSESLTLPAPESRGEDDRIASNPRIPANPRSIAEPRLSDELQKKYSGTVIVIRFLINRDGSVDEALIDEVRRYDKEREEYVVVRNTPAEILKSVLDAAHRWTFNPARNNGESVRSFTTAEFRFSR